MSSPRDRELLMVIAGSIFVTAVMALAMLLWGGVLILVEPK